MKDAIRVYEVHQEKGRLCEDVLRRLPQWFGIQSAIEKYIQEVNELRMLAADFGV
jgi:hypothetical protein